MNGDTKTDFYLRNRLLIEEWADLAETARIALEGAMFAGVDQLAGGDLPPVITRGRTNLALPITDEPACWIELKWEHKTLFKAAGGWPCVAITMEPKHSRQVGAAIRAATALRGEELGLLDAKTNGWWIRSGPVTPAEEPLEIEPYAALCVERFKDTWLAVHEPITAILGSTSLDA